MKTKSPPKQRGRARKVGHVQLSGDRSPEPEVGHDPLSDEITHLAPEGIHPSPENDTIYNPVAPTDPDFLAFVASVREHGRIIEPLIVTRDRFIISGHRRHAAAMIAGLDRVPCRIEDFNRGDPRFLLMLRECNRQRVKTLDETLREEVVSADPEESYRRLVEYRAQKAAVDVNTISLGAVKRRKRISEAKKPLLDAILSIVRASRDLGKLSVRQIFYQLLNVNPPPRVHAKKGV